ncbi:MAG TPA: hypothetical protein G4N96_07175 [Chloroflexi bacterium]|nr:MAG: hypothetical protein B6I38_10375 [Anaerolineaceae bacterium 4572_5.1]HEY84876.1 hypothetical protein [Chloroflexota bacterium]
MTVKEKVTLTLPSDLMRRVRQVAPPRGHSRFVTQAVEFYLEAQRQKQLEAQLAAGYQANAEKDRAIAGMWIAIEEDTWRAIEDVPQEAA